MDNYLVDQKYYTESYNATKGEPNWVSWHLDATNTTNASPRLDDFAGWSALPANWYMVVTSNYTNSGFDRGHNCPSADRTSSAGANAATFLMTNIIPQAPYNNEHTWANLENYLREQVVEGNEVYIIMGSYGTGGTGSKGAANTINNGHINVPSNVWKVAVIIPAGNGDINRVTASTRVIAVNTPNINTTDSDWTKYIVTVKDIELATGYTLLSNLPANVRTALEVKLDAGLPGA
jgi:endonuclease G